MNINKKISEIRLQPEHVRLRYVWGCVIVSMVVIFAIWIFSINSMFGGEKKIDSSSSESTTDLTNQLQNLKDQAPSLKDYASQPLTTGNEGVTSASKKSDDFQYPATNDTTQPQQTSAYSDLSNQNPAQ